MSARAKERWAKTSPEQRKAFALMLVKSRAKVSISNK